jgi:hypothetical protein
LLLSFWISLFLFPNCRHCPLIVLLMLLICHPSAFSHSRFLAALSTTFFLYPSYSGRDQTQMM